MADLTPQQLAFVQKFFDYDTKKYFQKKKLKEQVQEFFRRRDKAQVEIGYLPPDHPQLKALKESLTKATEKAQKGDMKGAYTDLKSVKETARAAATTVRSGVSVDAILGDLRVLETAMRRLVNEKSDICDYASVQGQRLIDLANLMLDPSTGRDREAILKLVSENYRQKMHILAEWDEMAADVKQKIETYRVVLAQPPSVTNLLVSIAHNIGLLNKQDPSAAAMPHNQQFVSADLRARNNHLLGKGDDLKTDADAVMRALRETLLDVLKLKSTPPPLDPTMFTDNEGNPLDEKAAKEAAVAMAERFKIAEAREAKRMESAREAFRQAATDDQTWLGLTEDRSPITDTRLRPFDTSEVIDASGIDVTDTKKRPDEIGAAAGKAVSDAMDKLMANGGIPDEVFEMATRSPNDWYVETAKSLGYVIDPKNPSNIDPTVWYKIKAAADEMKKVVYDKYPDKVACNDKGVMTSVTLGGVTYGEMKFLGSGGGGAVYKATDSSGNSVVVKVPKGFNAKKAVSEHDHQSLRKEGTNHRAVSGGEDGECPKNILDMKGMAMAPNGAPLIVMDLADAGDADDYTEAMGAAEHSGLITEPARQAMMAEQMRDILKGMMAMQAKGMTHHDLKEANVFLASDGTFKVADFGLGDHVDGHEGAVTGLEEFTPGYEPPELFGEGKATQKSDNFTLGEILERITDPKRKRGKTQEKFTSLNPGPDQKTDADDEVVMASSLDRMINRLKDPDPDKRPTLNGALLSSYFAEVSQDYTKEDLARLKKASAQYAKTVGRETADLNRNLTFAEGEILKLEKSKSDALILEKIENAEKKIAETQVLVNRLQRKMDVEWDEKAKAKLQETIDARSKSIVEIGETRDGLLAKIGVAKTSVELDDIDKKIAETRKQVIDLNKQIAAVHAKDVHKAVIDELNAANKAFV